MGTQKYITLDIEPLEESIWNNSTGHLFLIVQPQEDLSLRTVASLCGLFTCLS